MTPIRRSATRGGIDLGGTKIQAIIVDADNTVIGQSRCPTPHDAGPQGVADAMATALREAASSAGVETARLRGVGVGSPGEVDAATGAVTNAKNLPDWSASSRSARSSRRRSGPRSPSATTSASPPTPSTCSAPAAVTTPCSASSGAPASAAD